MSSNSPYVFDSNTFPDKGACEEAAIFMQL